MAVKVIEVTYDTYTDAWVVAPLDDKGFQALDYEYVYTKKEAMATTKELVDEYGAEIQKYTKAGKLQK